MTVVCDCRFEHKNDPLLECLEVGQEKYTIRKCEAGTTEYENGTKLAFHCVEGGRLEGDLQYQCFDGKWSSGSLPGCQSE